MTLRCGEGRQSTTLPSGGAGRGSRRGTHGPGHGEVYYRPRDAAAYKRILFKGLLAIVIPTSSTKATQKSIKEDKRSRR